MKFLLKTTLEAKVLQENEKDTVEHIDHIFDGGDDASVHTFTGLALTHFDGRLGDFITAI